METERGIDRLRRIMIWADYQHEFIFDDLDITEILLLFHEVTEKQNIDMVDDMANPTFDEWLRSIKI